MQVFIELDRRYQRSMVTVHLYLLGVSYLKSKYSDRWIDSKPFCKSVKKGLGTGQNLTVSRNCIKVVQLIAWSIFRKTVAIRSSHRVASNLLLRRSLAKSPSWTGHQKILAPNGCSFSSNALIGRAQRPRRIVQSILAAAHRFGVVCRFQRDLQAAFSVSDKNQ